MGGGGWSEIESDKKEIRKVWGRKYNTRRRRRGRGRKGRTPSMEGCHIRIGIEDDTGKWWGWWTYAPCYTAGGNFLCFFVCFLSGFLLNLFGGSSELCSSSVGQGKVGWVGASMEGRKWVCRWSKWGLKESSDIKGNEQTRRTWLGKLAVRSLPCFLVMSLKASGSMWEEGERERRKSSP